MGLTFLPPEDLPPTSITAVDETLRCQLEKSVAKRFYEACDGVTQGLLCQCNWHITTQARALTLVIVCSSAAANWRVLHNLVLLANQLARFSPHAKIRICPPPELGTPFELWIDEIAIS
jgi:hypothetical protein